MLCLGIQTWGCRTEGADGSNELWRPPNLVGWWVISVFLFLQTKREKERRRRSEWVGDLARRVHLIFCLVDSSQIAWMRFAWMDFPPKNWRKNYWTCLLDVWANIWTYKNILKRCYNKLKRMDSGCGSVGRAVAFIMFARRKSISSYHFDCVQVLRSRSLVFSVKASFERNTSKGGGGRREAAIASGSSN